MSANATVHVIGTGTIGEPLIGLLAAMKSDLGIDEITFHKRTPLLTDRSKVLSLLKKQFRLSSSNCLGDGIASRFTIVAQKPATSGSWRR